MCENGAELKKGKMLMTTTQGQRQEKTVGGKGGEIQT